jgi:hypothetical protein
LGKILRNKLAKILGNMGKFGKTSGKLLGNMGNKWVNLMIP